MNTEDFHQRLRRIRKSRGISVRDLAKRIGVPETTYREWEYGRSVRGQPYLKLSEVLEVSVYELLGGTSKTRVSVISRLGDLEKAVAALKVELMSFF